MFRCPSFLATLLGNGYIPVGRIRRRPVVCVPRPVWSRTPPLPACVDIVPPASSSPGSAVRPRCGPAPETGSAASHSESPSPAQTAARSLRAPAPTDVKQENPAVARETALQSIQFLLQYWPSKLSTVNDFHAIWKSSSMPLPISD